MKSHVVLAALLAAPALAQTPVSAPPPCTDAAYRQFDFWLGEWIVSDLAGKKQGDNSITREEGGCLILERWKRRQRAIRVRAIISMIRVPCSGGRSGCRRTMSLTIPADLTRKAKWNSAGKSAIATAGLHPSSASGAGRLTVPFVSISKSSTPKRKSGPNGSPAFIARRVDQRALTLFPRRYCLRL